MPSCQICGINPQNVEIHTRRYGVLDNTAKICKECFKLWQVDDLDSLDRLAFDKITRGAKDE